MIYIVTGISRGLGHAIVSELCTSNARVIGVGRSNPFGEAIQFHTCDLADPKAVASLSFDLEGASAVTLINNAGILGKIGRISENATSDLEEVMQVNVFAPMALTRKVQAALDAEIPFTLVNISSGAAHRSIPSWASYCASKAALNRLTENWYLEGQELDQNIRAYAVAPGVIDTGMQAQIRSVSSETFSAVADFIRMKEEGTLYSSQVAAHKLLSLLEKPYSGEVFYDLRNV